MSSLLLITGKHIALLSVCPCSTVAVTGVMCCPLLLATVSFDKEQLREQ